MSIYAVNKVCRRAVADPAFAEALRADAAATLLAATPPLSEHERELVLAGNVGALGRLGANFFLLHQLGRLEVCGLTLPLYAERIRAEYASERAQWASERAATEG